MNNKLNEARNIIRKNPSLIWYSRSYDSFSLEVIVEAVLNYGSWENFLELKSILGTIKLSKIFNELSQKKRSNLHPLAKNYFANFFAKYVP